MGASGRTVAWTLGILAIVLVVIPLLAMIGMMGIGGMMRMGGTMMEGGTGGMLGMHAAGLLWMVLAVVVVVALVVVLLSETNKTYRGFLVEIPREHTREPTRATSPS